jgi:hypothetical protein
MERNPLGNVLAARPIERREFGFALAALGAAAIPGLPANTPALHASAGAPDWVSVLAALGRELASTRPAPGGATVCTPSGWVLTGGEADACRRIHERVG